MTEGRGSGAETYYLMYNFYIGFQDGLLKMHCPIRADHFHNQSADMDLGLHKLSYWCTY